MKEIALRMIILMTKTSMINKGLTEKEAKEEEL